MTTFIDELSAAMLNVLSLKDIDPGNDDQRKAVFAKLTDAGGAGRGSSKRISETIAKVLYGDSSDIAAIPTKDLKQALDFKKKWLQDSQSEHVGAGFGKARRDEVNRLKNEISIIENHISSRSGKS